MNVFCGWQERRKAAAASGMFPDGTIATQLMATVRRDGSLLVVTLATCGAHAVSRQLLHHNTNSNRILTVKYEEALPCRVTSGFTELKSVKVAVQSVPQRRDVVSRRRVAERLAAALMPPSGMTLLLATTSSAQCHWRRGTVVGFCFCKKTSSLSTYTRVISYTVKGSVT